MGVHRIFWPDLAGEGEVVVTGPEAHHAARVKRLGPGDGVEILNGQGLRAEGRVAGVERPGRGAWAVRCLVERAAPEPRTTPRVRALACAPKLTRVEDMVDQLSQVGAAVWTPLVTRYTVDPPRQGRTEKLERVAREAAKQCGRAWVLEIGEPTALATALAGAREQGARLVIADPSGAPYRPDGSARVDVLIGPEGGFAPEEVEAAREAGADVCWIGPHLMRVATAAVVATGIVLHAERGASRPPAP